MYDDSRDQWLTTGDCEKCRRAPHCSKLCTASKRAIRAAHARMMAGLAATAVVEANRQLSERLNKREG